MALHANGSNPVWTRAHREEECGFHLQKVVCADALQQLLLLLQSGSVHSGATIYPKAA